ncbi:probable G-protein coupled receptor 34b [Thalassophryne amazonica]|uniref:probable G-protein coupled receptor 34b n=1 Tax=Thalassophryne amazonica TaxID=390379 RepID=UPI0014709BA4|nr:probable G-protein coupled receptor 34b [Thalassophryne amazonica]
MTKNFATTSTYTSQSPNVSSFIMTTNSSWMDVSLNLVPQQNCSLDDSSLQIPLAVLYSLIFTMGLCGNVLALWMFFTIHTKKNSVHVYLINTAFADLLLVVCLPFRVIYHSQGNRWNMSPTLCNIVGNLFYMNMYISILLLGLISVDRYLKIHRGARVQHRLQSTRWSTAICAVIWFLSSVLILMFMTSKNNSELHRCFHYKQLFHAKWKAYINIFVLVIFWLIFFSLAVSYGKIAMKLIKTSQDKPDLPNAARYIHTARKSFFVLFVFTFCFVPYHMTRVFYIYTQIMPTSCSWMGVADKVNEMVLVFSALNSCLDPVMYFLLSSAARKRMLQMVNHRFCSQDYDFNPSTSAMELDKMIGATGRGQPTASFTSTLRENVVIGSSKDELCCHLDPDPDERQKIN